MLKKANIRNLEQKAQGYVKSRKDYVRGVDANTLLEDIYSEYNLDKSNINTTNSPINQLQNMGSSPQAPSQPSAPSWFKPR